MKNIFIILFLSLVFPLQLFASDFQIRSTINKDQYSSVAYNSVDDEYFVVWTELSSTTITLLGQRMQADGSGKIGAAVTISTIGAYPSVAYNYQSNEYLVTFSLSGNIIGTRVSNVGTLIGTPITYISKTNSIYSKVVYNELANNYLLVAGELTDLGNDQANIKIHSRKISVDGQPAGIERLIRDQGHGNYSDGARFAISYAPIVSNETPTGRYLLAIKDPTDLTMLDENGIIVSKVNDSQHPGNIVDDHIPFQQSKIGTSHNVDLAFGNFEGEDIFMVVWGDKDKQYQSQSWSGIWAGIVNATQIEYESNDGASNTVFPASAIFEHSIDNISFKSWKPVIAYNKAAYKFMVAWRETPTNIAGNDTKVSHIRANTVFSSLPPVTPNEVLSATMGNEDPMAPVITASEKNPNAFVAWEDSRNISTNDIDLYGNLLTTTAAKSIVITSPNGGEVWQEGLQKQITWESNGIGATSVKIEYSIDYGASFNLIAVQTNTDGLNTYNWTVPNTPSKQCLIKITSSDLMDYSDLIFTIIQPPQISVVTPNGGESWIAGSQNQIKWESANVGNYDVQIEYSTNNGNTYNFIDFVTNNDGQNTYNWKIPNNVSNQCLVKVSVLGVTDISDDIFSIIQDKGIKVIAPNGGEVWKTASIQEIKWLSTNQTDSVVIFLDWDTEGPSGVSLVSHTPNDGSFYWKVPDFYFLDSVKCKIRIIDYKDQEYVTAQSEFHFIVINNTQVGENISLDLGEGADILFESVDSSGTTNLEVTETGSPTPNDFSIIGSPNYYNIKTTSSFTGNVKITLNYSDSGLTELEESNLQLNVFDTLQVKWVNITTSLDLDNNKISGEVNHLSEFAILMPNSDSQVYIVKNTNDFGEGSFRKAIVDANLNGSPDKIVFNIPKSDPNYDVSKGIWYIKPVNYFESFIDSGTVVDGSSQRIFIGEDTNPEGPEIVLSGISMSTNNSCLTIQGNNIEVYGLTINNFSSAGIVIANSNNNIISGCYIGTDYSGMKPEGNRNGIEMGPNVNGSLIGPSNFLDEPNVISGNLQNGIFIVENSQNNGIIGNYIGVNKIASDTLQNKLRGIDLSRGANNNTIMENIIGGNYQGIYISESNKNLLIRNKIGTNGTWEYDLSNSNGILVFNNSSENIIRENVIGYNRGWGIKISGSGSIKNKISWNSISKNLGSGIDNSDGGNNEISPPVILSVSSNQVSGTSGPNQLIEIFADSSNEGKEYLESTVSDASGNFSITLGSSPVLPNITATATDDLNNTSEFSFPIIITEISEMENKIPTEYVLEQNYPNPFNPSTKISYRLPVRSEVKLTIYNVLGKEVRRLLNEVKEAGIYSFEFDASNLPSGVYYYSLSANDFNMTKKMMFVK